MLRRLLKPFAAFFEGHTRAHYRLERYSLGLTLGIIAAAMIGGFVEIAPLFTIEETVEEAPEMRVYTTLEQAGRDIYIREGCYLCHSQMIRTLESEVDRYGDYSLAVESQYGHPMLWGSKRTGPDLARVGGKYSDAWHVAHLTDPQSVVPESVMPDYGWLLDESLDLENMSERLRTLRRVGVPYSDAMIANAAADARAQAGTGSAPDGGVAARYGEDTNIRDFDGQPGRITEMDALVAYLQILGELVDRSAVSSSQEDM